MNETYIYFVIPFDAALMVQYYLFEVMLKNPKAV